MRPMRRIRHRGPLMAAATAAAGFALVACEPGNGMSIAAVAITTDRTGTHELEQQGVDVRWLTCTASYASSGGGGETTGTSPSARSVASVDCKGEAEDGRDLTIKGRVTQEVNGTCVRGDLTARVDGKERFRVHVLGNCRAGTPGTPGMSTPRTTPPRDPGATVTVTRTVTEYPSPGCSCFQGK
ncbi:hypothetical protein ACFFS2_02060 [Streptomyces aurantiacus]